MRPLQPTISVKDSILYEDSQILLCYKRAGLSVQTKKLQEKDLISLLKNYLAQKTCPNPYLAVINRLDQPVEGIVLFAKTKEAAAHLTRQLNQHNIQKKYLAITSAPLPKVTGTLKDYLRKDPTQNCSCVVSSNTPNGKLAVLDYKVLATDKAHSLVEIMLHTGRHHQIRVQLSNLQAPLLGDRKYKGEEARQLCLCSYLLSFTHPTTKQQLTFQVTPKNPAFEPFFSYLKEGSTPPVKM